MIIDAILDRMSGIHYDMDEFKNYVETSEGIFFSDNMRITKAFESGDESKVKEALMEYVDANGHHSMAKDYIKSVDWIVKPLKPNVKEKIILAKLLGEIRDHSLSMILRKVIFSGENVIEALKIERSHLTNADIDAMVGKPKVDRVK